MPKVIEIVKVYLSSIGADGLLCPNECACTLDDLVPCSRDFALCEPGWIGPPSSEDHGEWSMYGSKASADAARAAAGDSEVK